MAETIRSPYVGLRPFSAADAAFFFGRENERRIVGANLTSSRFTVLYGPSGVGKSSVLDGGIVYDFAQMAKRTGPPRFAAAYFRDWSKWRDDPMRGLTQAVQEQLKRDYSIDLGVDGGTFRASVDAWMDTQPGGLLIVLDQFEEYLLYHGSEESSDSFSQEFPAIVADPDLRVNFLVSLRDDALARLDRFKGQIPGLFENRLELKLLSREAGKDAILRPLDELRRLNIAAPEIEDDLVQAVLNQVAAGKVRMGATGGGDTSNKVGFVESDRPIEAPYLQLVMERVWKEEETLGSHTLRLATFQRLGEAQKIIQDHLDSRMARLSEPEQDVAAKVFKYLVTPSGAKIALSSYDLAHSAGLKQQVVTPVLDRLAGGKARILRAVASPKDAPHEERYEIFHDALARAILDWTDRRREKQLRTERRRRVAAGIAAVVLGASVLALVLYLDAKQDWANDESHARSLAALAARSVSDDPDRALLVALYGASLTYGKNEKLLPELEEALHRTLEVARGRGIIAVQGGRVFDVAVSPDGSTLASGDTSGTIHLWDAASGRETGTLSGHTGAVRRIAFSPDGGRLASGSDDSTARIWQIWPSKPDQKPLILRGHSDAIQAIAYHPRGRWIITGSFDGTIRRWDAQTGDPVNFYVASAHGVSSVAFADMGDRVVGAGNDNSLKVWTLSGDLHCEFAGRVRLVNAIAGLPLSAQIATADMDGDISVQDTDDCTNLRSFAGHTNALFDLAISRDGSSLATASYDGTVKVWRTATGEELFSLRGHSGPVSGVKFSSDGRLYTASWDSTVRAWDGSRVMSEVDVLQPEREDVVIRAVAFNPQRAQLAAADQTSGRLLISYLFHRRRSYSRSLEAPAYSVAFSPDGKTLAVGSGDGVAVLDAETAGLLARLDTIALRPDTIGGVMAVSFSPDGKRVALGGSSGLVALWNPADSSVVRLRAHRERVNSVAFNRSGDRLVTAGDDATVLEWALDTTGTPFRTIATHPDRATSAVFSPSAGLLATSGEDHVIRLTSTRQGDQSQTFRLPNNTIWTVAFSPDGSQLASANFDGTARVWSIASGQEILRLRSNRGRMYGVAFSGDGSYVAASGNRGQVQVSIIDPLALLLDAWSRVSRPLTNEECLRLLGIDARKCPRAPALVAEGRKLAQAGEVSKAIAKFAEAKDEDPIFRHIDPDSLARALAAEARISSGLAYLRGTRMSEAMDEFKRARMVDSSRARDVVPGLVSGISDVMNSGDTSIVATALEAYRDAMSWDKTFTPTAVVLNSVCWWGTIGGHAYDVSDTCEAAVKASPDFGSIRDSRGVNRAIRGDTAGALDDFRAFVATATNPEHKSRRLRWIKILEAGGASPFTKKELAELRVE